MESFEKRYWDMKDEIRWRPEIYMPNKDGIITDFVPFITPTASQQVTFFGSGYIPRMNHSASMDTTASLTKID